MSDKLEDHIDEPIKKCVVDLSLLGFETVMSCCGFSYEGEKVDKKHLGKAYIYLLMNDLNLSTSLSSTLIKLSALSNWKIGSVNGSFFDKGMLFDFHADTWSKDNPWTEINCPHYHEQFNIAIFNLEKALSIFQPSFLDEVVIKDGNRYYAEKMKGWQYNPTRFWKVKKEDYDLL